MRKKTKEKIYQEAGKAVRQYIDAQMEQTHFEAVQKLYQRAFEEQLQTVNTRHLNYKLKEQVDRIFEEVTMDLLKKDPEIRELFRKEFGEAIKRVFEPPEKSSDDKIEICNR